MRPLMALALVTLLAAPGCLRDRVVLGGTLRDGGAPDGASDAGMDGGMPLDGPGPDAPALALEVSPEALAFTHVVGVSPCPQPVGTVVLRAPGATEATAFDVDALRVFLQATPTMGAVPTGGEARIDVAFTCDLTGEDPPFDAMLVLRADGLEANVPIAGTVIF
ncbi:MAG: hypothetical protein AAGH15_18335 [Myxococcota bacterium]